MELNYIYRGIIGLTLAGGVLAGNAGSALLLLPKEASDGRLDTLLLGCFVEGVLAAVTTAGVTPLAILQASQTVGAKGELLDGEGMEGRMVDRKNDERGKSNNFLS